MMPNLSGKVALVTGGAGGIGRALGEKLLQEGAKVCLVDYNENDGRETEEELAKQYGMGRIMFSKCNVTNLTELEATFKFVMSSFGRLDIVFNNAGILDERQLENMINVNLKAVVDGTTLGIKYMSAVTGGDGGLIINTASGAGIVPFPPAPVYAATKYAVIGYTLSIGTDKKRKTDRVKVVCLCPSFTDTNLIKFDDRPDALSDIKTFQKLGKNFTLMKPTVVAEQAFGLLEESTTSGSVLLLDPSSEPRFVQMPMYYGDLPTSKV